MISDNNQGCVKDHEFENYEDIQMDYQDTDEEPFDLEFRENKQNCHKYEKLVVTADRYRISSRAAAAIVNSALEDMGILDENNMIDRKKIERERNRVGN